MLSCLIAIVSPLFSDMCLCFSPGTEADAYKRESLAGDVTLSPNSDFTFEVWLNPAVDNLAENRVMGITDWASEGRLVLELRKHASTGNANKAVLLYRADGENYRTKAPQATIPAGRWSHVAVTRRGSELTVFVNGRLDSVETNYQHALLSVPLQMAMGFNGEMSEARVWSRARSEKELVSDGRRRLSGREAALLGYWPMNESSLPLALRNSVTGALAVSGFGGTSATGTVAPVEASIFAEIDGCLYRGGIGRGGVSFSRAGGSLELQSATAAESDPAVDAFKLFDSRYLTCSTGAGYNLKTTPHRGLLCILR